MVINTIFYIITINKLNENIEILINLKWLKEL